MTLKFKETSAVVVAAPDIWGLVPCHCRSGRKRGWWKPHCAVCEKTCSDNRTFEDMVQQGIRTMALENGGRPVLRVIAGGKDSAH
jgi:hypothetical protein